VLNGTVFDDRNRNFVRDPGEAGVAGQRLYVDLDTDSEQDPTEPTTVSDASGHYAFEGLDPGTYTVAMLYAGGWSMTPGDGHTRQITLLPGQVLTRDWGVERYVSSVSMVYNNSAFDGNDPAATAADDNATEAFKGPLFPGQQGSPYNVSNYTKGINAITLDIGALPILPGGPPLSAADFVFRVGNVSDTASWSPAPAPTEVAVRRGADPRGTDRVTVIFPDNSIRNTWLEVTVLPTPRTGIVEPLVVYFGNLVGDGAIDGGDLRVNALDLAAVRRALNTAATVESRVDFNKDGRVNSLDLAAVRSNLTRTIAPIQPPAPPPPPPAAARRADDDTRATSLLTAPN
jgi:hypothetical protein